MKPSLGQQIVSALIEKGERFCPSNAGSFTGDWGAGISAVNCDGQPDIRKLRIRVSKALAKNATPNEEKERIGGRQVFQDVERERGTVMEKTCKLQNKSDILIYEKIKSNGKPSWIR